LQNREGSSKRNNGKFRIIENSCNKQSELADSAKIVAQEQEKEAIEQRTDALYQKISPDKCKTGDPSSQEGQIAKPTFSDSPLFVMRSHTSELRVRIAPS